jgi:uncharacterized membrane protein
MNCMMKIIFTLSVLANILLLGGIGGMYFHPKGPVPWEEATENLSPQGQQQVSAAFKDTWKEMVPLFKKAGEARRDLTGVMAAAQFDEPAFDRAAKNLHTVQDQINDKKLAAAKTLVAQLSPEDRKKFAEHLARSFSWRGGGDGVRKYPRYNHPPQTEEKSQ